jgi:hypothetical protein
MLLQTQLGGAAVTEAGLASAVDVGLWVAAWGMQSFLVESAHLVICRYRPG